MNLYDLTQEARALEDLILEACNPETGELPENVMEIIEQWSEKVGGDLNTKLEAIGRLVRNWEADADKFEAEAKRLAANKKAAENRAKRAKEWTKICLDSAGIAKQKAGIFDFAIQKNGGAVPIVQANGQPIADIDATTIPAEYQVVKVTPNTEAIREALKAGTELDFAKFGVVGTHLRIR